MNCTDEQKGPGQASWEVETEVYERTYHAMESAN